MKNSLKLFSVLLVGLFVVSLVSGCEKREDLTFKGDEGTITFKVPEGKYKISTKAKDKRTSREQGVLVGKDFKIGIEFCDDYKYFFNSNFNKMKKAREDYDDLKEVTYSGEKGIQFFNSGYMDYEIMIPVKNNKDYYLDLCIHPKKETEKDAKKLIKSKEVQDILNNMEFKAKSK